jgi:hypothetical protein
MTMFGTGDDESRGRIVAGMGEEPRRHVDDVEREPVEGEPPVPGAQWDEVHQRWEAWDEGSQQWVVVGDGGDGVDPAAENLMPPLLARELQHAEELEAADEPDVVDVERAPEPPSQVPGAQWNEVKGCWERWDDASGDWVEVPAE